MKGNDANLFNWTPEKNESPYSYGSEYPKFENKEFNWRILTPNEVVEGLTDKDLIVEVGIFCEMWDLHLIEKLRLSYLVRPVRYRKKSQAWLTDFFEIRDEFENLIDVTLPVKVYISYPFSETLELTIFPVKMTTFFSKIQTKNSYWIGYIAWQIAKLYEKIYKGYMDEVGIGGHSLSDLQLSVINVYGNNLMTIDVSS